MNKACLLGSILFWTGLTSAGAQDNAPNLMTTPVMARANFTIKVGASISDSSSSSDSTPAPPVAPRQPKTPIQIDVSRFDDVQRNAIMWSDDSKSTDWVSENILLMKGPYGNGISVIQVASYPFKDAFFFVTFRDFFRWISPATFVDRQTYEGMPANFFRRSGQRAWIDPKTGTLLAYDDGVQRYSFMFSVPPKAPMQIPPEYAAPLILNNRPAPQLRGANKS
jgi:hypothetical protein